MSQFPSIDFTVGHFFKGPRNARVLSKVSYVEFISEDARSAFLHKVGGESAHVGGTHVKIKNALTKVNAARNFALRQAEEKLKKDPRCLNSEVKAVWSKPRVFFFVFIFFPTPTVVS